jgi:hypothetical protein
MVALGLHLLGIVPLMIAAIGLVVPAAIAGVVVAARDAETRRLAVSGLIAGLVAVTVYDAFRLPLVAAGVWGDPTSAAGPSVASTAIGSSAICGATSGTAGSWGCSSPSPPPAG